MANRVSLMAYLKHEPPEPTIYSFQNIDHKTTRTPYSHTEIKLAGR